jgi:hypothetical protein
VRPLALALWVLAAPPAGKGAPARDPDAPVVLSTPADAGRLCQSLDFPERASRREPEVDRAAAEGRQEKRRARALERRYRVDLDGRGLAFDHDEGGRRLLLTERARLVALGGALVLWPTEEPEMPVPADAARARRIAAAAARGEVLLRLTFALPEDEEVAVCAHPPGASGYGLGMEPVSWAYLAGAEVLASGGEPAERREAPQGARPAVTVGEPMGAGAGSVRPAVEAQARELEACYRRARQARPALDGTLAVELELGAAGGPPLEARVAMDSLLDEGLSRCALAALRRASFPRGAAGRVQVPLHFTLEAPAGR